jgi:hypothetical protein
MDDHEVLHRKTFKKFSTFLKLYFSSFLFPSLSLSLSLYFLVTSEEKQSSDMIVVQLESYGQNLSDKAAIV